MLDNFFLVWNPNGPHGGYPTVRHPNIDSAKAEAARLARANPGEVFHVLYSVGTCRAVDVEWTEHDQIPF